MWLSHILQHHIFLYSVMLKPRIITYEWKLSLWFGANGYLVSGCRLCCWNLKDPYCLHLARPLLILKIQVHMLVETTPFDLSNSQQKVGKKNWPCKKSANLPLFQASYSLKLTPWNKNGSFKVYSSFSLSTGYHWNQWSSSHWPMDLYHNYS
jgi:hypothetical protein